MFFKRSGGASWLIVFLGNPGKEYENTRHNAGFLAADAMEKRLGTKINKAKFSSLTALVRVGNEGVLLLKPQTYMNLSGRAVGEAVRFYKIPPERVIVISDETALPLGRVRVRRSGSAGGHNGPRTSSPPSVRRTFPASASASAASRMRTMTCATGSSPALRARTPRRSPTRPPAPPRPRCAISKRARTRP